MAILTLTSDWGLRDHYLASFKGLLLSQIPGIHVIDISHDIEHYNMIQAAFIVRNAFDKFPAGSIHLLGITNSENCTSEKPFVVIRHKEHYFIGEDNGIFSLIVGRENREIVRLPFNRSISRQELYNSTIQIIRRISEGEFNSLGENDQSIVESFLPQVTTDNNNIRGTIIFIDSFGNTILNISKEQFEKQKNKRKFSIQFRKSQYEISEISNWYSDVEIGEIIAFFNQDDFLEIALNRDSAAKLLGLRIMDPVRIEFFDNN
jgi:S-adenosylmethionine hydrolase